MAKAPTPLRDKLNSEEVTRLYVQEKRTPREIGNLFGVSQNTVRRKLKDLGVYMPNSSGRYHKVDIAPHLGKKFGRLVVVGELPEKDQWGKTLWLCKCDCGKEVEVAGYYVVRGSVISCGRKCNRLVGKRIGRLEVIRRTDRRYDDKSWYWECRCDCGRITYVITSHLQGKNPTKSCGCLTVDLTRARAKVKGISLDRGIRSMFAAYRDNAIKAGRVFELTFEQFEDLSKQSCYYCGQIPAERKHYRRNKQFILYTANGIDRLDSTKGYFIGNVVSCCGMCNHAKKNHSYDKFTEWIAQLVEFQNQQSSYVTYAQKAS